MQQNKEEEGTGSTLVTRNMFISCRKTTWKSLRERTRPQVITELYISQIKVKPLTLELVADKLGVIIITTYV